MLLQTPLEVDELDDRFLPELPTPPGDHIVTSVTRQRTKLLATLLSTQLFHTLPPLFLYGPIRVLFLIPRWVPQVHETQKIRKSLGERVYESHDWYESWFELCFFFPCLLAFFLPFESIYIPECKLAVLIFFSYYEHLFLPSLSCSGTLRKT